MVKLLEILTLPSKHVFSRNAPMHPVNPIIKVIPPKQFKDIRIL